MKIEIASKKNDPTKVKGDLLEALSRDLLEAQGYHFIDEVRFTGMELDGLCKNKINGKQIYVESKAQSGNISATILRQLLGTITFKNYAEGWLLSIAGFSKDAKGFVEEWKAKPIAESSKLSFFQPDDIISSLQAAAVIASPPKDQAAEYIGGEEFVGEWTLFITTYGRFWTAYTLQGGAPQGVLVYNAKNNRHIQDEKTLTNLSQLENPLTEYDLNAGLETTKEHTISKTVQLPNVVEVQTGDSWEDYRPARPQDFVGRENTQKEIFNFLDSVKEQRTNTRIFAITGNSGLGKSSLIAKLRDRSRNKFYKNRYFTFAIDMRGAQTSAYISSSLLKCLKAAQQAGFGDKVELQLTDPSSPLSSPSINQYLETVEKKGQIICLIFDQFEELYSKPELFSVFSAAKSLMLDVVSHKGNFVLGFAWKTDSTTQQDHPAYHMWHELSDYRKVYKLKVFDKSEISKALTTFEKEVGQKIPKETRNQISYSCQGFPWLLKKLCISLFEDLKKGSDTGALLADLDVGKLFENDLETLTQNERSCLDIIAQKAPADWSEIIEISGVTTINNLVAKRLVIKSGDRLNVYWDIFKDYLLTKNVPIVPFNFIPTTDLPMALKVSQLLENNNFLDASEIAKKSNLQERTVWNIGADLVMFGLAERRGTSFRQHKELANYSEDTILQKVRDKIGKHSLKLALYKHKAGKTVDKNLITKTLKSCLPTAKFSEKTWIIYTNRLTNLLIHTGYLIRASRDFIVQDTGVAMFDKTKNRRAKGTLFSATASPASVCDALSFIEANDNYDASVSKGYRNSLSVLKRFDLISVKDDKVILNNQSIKKYGGYKEAVWTATKNEPVVVKCIEKTTQEPDISGPKLGAFVSSQYSMGWTPASEQRNGNSLKQWSVWIKEGIDQSLIPTPLGRSK